MLSDPPKLRGLRKRLVEELRDKGISDERILNAFLDIPRHYFIERAFSEWAYKDVAFPIDAEQTISQPYTVAVQTLLLDIEKGDKVLEIGTGSGFQACVLNYMGCKVYTIERQQILYDKTEKLLRNIGFGRIRTLFGDGFEGAPKFAPFDKIIVTAGATNLPIKLLNQLKPGGVLVIPVGDNETQKMLRIIKKNDGSFTKEKFGDFKFVPFLNGVITK